MIRKTVFLVSLFCGAATAALADGNGLHSINGVPLYIDGAQSGSQQVALSPVLIDQAKTVTTLGDALRILGPAYVTPGDSMHIAHWHFQNGAMVTLWPQGGEALADPVSLRPRPDCGVPANQCMDLILDRKKGTAWNPPQAQSQQQQQQNGGLPSTKSMKPLMNQVAQQRGIAPGKRAIANSLLNLLPGR
jgi:hypothetical protein